jgi:hypothetical protein
MKMKEERELEIKKSHTSVTKVQNEGKRTSLNID